MAGYRYVGPPVGANEDIVYKSYVDSIKSADLTVSQIDAAITSGLTNYATRAYVNSQDALNADTNYIDNQDNLRVKTARKDVPNGVAGLDSFGRVQNSRINALSTQRYTRGPWSPSAYLTGEIPIPAETTLYTMNVTDPGYPYKIIVFGTQDAHVYSDFDIPAVVVRAGSVTGDTVGIGYGASDTLENGIIGDDFNRANTGEGLGDEWETVYSPGTGAIQITSNAVNWVVGGNSSRSVRCRNISPTSKNTGTDYQKILVTFSSWTGESQEQPNQWFRTYARANDAFTSWVALEHTAGFARWMYSVNGVETYLTGYFATSLGPNQTHGLICGDFASSTPRRFQWYKNGVLVNTYDDNAAVTAMGANFRGWGFGMAAQPRFLGQATPPTLDSIFVTDNLVNYAPVNIRPVLSTQATKTGPTTLYIRGFKAGSNNVSVDGFRPNIHVMCVPA